MSLKTLGKFIGDVFEQEIPSGAVNSVNVTFTLSFTPHSAKAIQVYLNGRQLILNYHYTVSGNVLTFAFAPDEGQIVHVTYIKK